MRQIKPCVFALVALCCFVVGARRLNLCRMAAQVVPLSVGRDLSDPLVHFFAPLNTFESVDAFAVMGISVDRRDPEVTASTVQAIPVSVVYERATTHAENEVMQRKGFVFTRSDLAKVAGVPEIFTPVRTPRESTYSLKVFRIDNSELILRQCNVSNRLIVRLDDNGVRTPRATFHDLTSNEIVRSGRTPSVYPPPYKSAMEIGGTRG